MNIEQTLTEIKQRTDYSINKKILKESVLKDLHIAYQNGLFVITPYLIAFLNSWDDAELVLEDTFENPIIINREEFMTLCKQQYHQVMLPYWKMWQTGWNPILWMKALGVSMGSRTMKFSVYAEILHGLKLVVN